MSSPRKTLWSHDLVLIGSMLVLAACGLIYEYLIAHYATRIIGAVETTIYAMIGTMIVSMGIGAFLAKYVKCPYRGFIQLELLIGFLGGTAIFIMAGAVFISYQLPDQLQQVYGLHESMQIQGPLIAFALFFSKAVPFMTGFFLGLLIGIEIPLIARMREQEYKAHLTHNIGTIYGADYIGAGIGAAIWVLVCLQMPIVQAATYTAFGNLLIGVVFLLRYKKRLKQVRWFWLAHVGLAVLLGLLMLKGEAWVQGMNNALFKDKVIHSVSTPYQTLTVTERLRHKGGTSALSLYINGRLQFSASDEVLYHAFLTQPAMLAAARQDKVLVIGGGDGLALREIWRYPVKQVTLVDLDQKMINLFSAKDESASAELSQRLLDLTESSFLDKRLELIIGDGFIEVENLIRDGRVYDVIIVDLPDPHHPVLNKLYSDYFYTRLKELLAGDGIIAVQSTSPYHAKRAFLAIGNTMQAAGLKVQQYHANVPSFGEWGWSIASKYGAGPLARLKQKPVEDYQPYFLSKEMILASFVFYPSYFDQQGQAGINHLGSHLIYNLHQQAWEKENGIFYLEK